MIDQRTAIATTAELGARIHRRRKALGLTQGEVADVVGVNRRVLGELENGKQTVQLRIALEAARAVGLDLALIERGDG